MNVNVSTVSSFFKKPLVLIVLIGLIIRFVLIPFVYDFDIYHWGVIVANINSGHNLYELDGYYYTPVWGYLVGFTSSISEFFFNGLIGMRITDMLAIETLQHPYHIATITTIAFSFCMKIPMILCDIVVGYLIYWLIKDRTGNEKKATIGFALWFLCPIVVYMSGVQAMFDTFSALFLMLTVILLYKNQYFLGGAMFSVAVLLKFFPGFCIIVLIAYILVKHKEDGLAKKKVLEAAIGTIVMTVILLLPLALNGQLGDMLTFITGRTDGSMMILPTMISTVIAVGAVFVFGYMMYHTPTEDADRKFFVYVFLIITASTLISATPQYVIVMLPFLIFYILVEEKSYFKCWVIISFAAFISAFALNNFSLLCSLAVYTGIVSPEWVVSSMQFLETGMGFNIINIISSVAAILQYFGILLILILFFEKKIGEVHPKLGDIVHKIKYWRVADET